MADPTGTLEPRPGDSSNMLLQKILLNLADLPGTFITPAEGDLRYLKLTGGTLSGNLLIGPYGVSSPVTAELVLSRTDSAPNVVMLGYTADNFVRGYRARGTNAAPAAVQANDAMLSFNGGGYNSSAFTGTKIALVLAVSETWTTAANGTRFNFSHTLRGSTTLADYVSIIDGAVSAGRNNRTISASWGVTGTLLHVLGNTTTDAVSAGTVATAVFSSFAAPTLAATNATTFTDAANLYIAGDVAAGANVTLTNSYGLWNVGKTRLDGTLYQYAVGYGPTFFGRRANGSLGTPTAVTNGQQLLDLSGGGYSGSGWVDNAAFVGLYATENWSASALGSKFAVGTTPIGSTTAVARLSVESTGSVILNSAAIATTATDGFLYVAACAGTPTGVPTAVTGRIPIVVNSTNHKLYFYSGGAWRDAGP